MQKLYSGRTAALFRELLGLIRKELGPQFSDWKDLDDWLMAQLSMTRADVLAIYEDCPAEMPWTASAVQSAPAVRPDFDWLSEFVRVPLECGRIDLPEPMLAVTADCPGHPVLLTSADAPDLYKAEGQAVELRSVSRGHAKPRGLGLYACLTGELVYAQYPDDGN